MRYIPLRYLQAALVVVGMIATTQSRAATVFSEDFEGLTVGTALTTANSAFDLNISGGGTFDVRNDIVPQFHHPNPTTGSAFTGSNYMLYSDSSSSPLLRGDLSSDLDDKFTISFDYYETTNNSATQTAVRVVLGDGASSTSSTSNRVFEINLDAQPGEVAPGDGAATVIGAATLGGFVATTYNPNELVHFDIVGSFSTESVDVYVNGNLELTAAGFRAEGFTKATEFALISHNSGSRKQTAFFDNFVITNTADPPIVPEPSTALLIGLGGLGMACLRRRTRR